MGPSTKHNKLDKYLPSCFTDQLLVAMVVNQNGTRYAV